MEQIHKEKAQFSPDFLLHKCKKDTLIPAQQKRGVLHVGNPLDREEGATFGDPAPSWKLESTVFRGAGQHIQSQQIWEKPETMGEQSFAAMACKSYMMCIC